MKLRTLLPHALLSYLFALGMALTALAVTGLEGEALFAALLLAGLSAGVMAVSLNRHVAIVAGCASAVAAVVWIILGGWHTCQEVFNALMLHLSGLPTALPMVRLPFTVLLSAVCLGAAWFVTQRSAGAYPALILLVLMAVLLWLGDYPHAAAYLLPGVLSAVTLLLCAGDEATSPWRVLPLSALVTAVAAGCIWMGGAVSTPMKDFADDVRQRIYDTFFYTQPRDVFTLATEGYYPQGMNQLGGPATPREEPVMAVITPRKVYLRGVVKNVYTGRVWLDDIGGRRYLWSASQFGDIRAAAFDTDLPVLDGTVDAALLTPTLLQVRMLRDSASTLFVPQRLRALTPEGSLIPYFNRSSEVFATANLVSGDVWTVEAPLFTSMDRGVERLVNAAEGYDDRWDAVCDTYLQLHDQIDERVYDIAREVTAGADTPYGKAIALQSWLAANYRYDLNVPEQSPNHDFVSTFLIEGEAGYCTYFASAMTVMCRMAGLPARYVEGYVAYPDETGLAIVTGQEGHAWTEVYFRGFGWVTFDATPTSAEYTDYAPDTDPDQADDPASTPAPTEAPTEAPTATPEPSSAPEDASTPTPAPGEAPAPETAPTEAPAGRGFPWWMVWVAVLAAAARLTMTQPAVQVLTRKAEFDRWMVWAQACHDALARMGYTRGKSESPKGFFRRVMQSGTVTVPLQALCDAENLMFYAHTAPYPEETAQARDTFRALYKALKPGQKALFHLRRMGKGRAFTK